MIRFAEEADIPQILDIYGPYILNTTASFEYTVPTVEEFTARFRGITDRFPWLVWEEAGVVLGYAYGSAPFERAAYQWAAEASVYLRPRVRGRGIGKTLYRVLEALLGMQGYTVIYAIITSENRDSLAFHEALGYREVAELPDCGFKFGRVLGVKWLEKRLISGDFPSEAPVKWRSIVKNDRNFLHNLAKMTLS